MNYTPLNYDQINVLAGTYNPSMVKSFNNQTFAFWERSLFQRATSTLKFNLPKEWQGNVRDFFLYCLFKFGYVVVFNEAGFGKTFQPCSLMGYNWYYQPTTARVSNPQLQKDFTLGENAELIKLTPDYMPVWDIISYYAEKLSVLDNAINMSLINNKFAFFMGARNKQAGMAIQKMIDKVNKGEPAIVYDMKLLNDPSDKAEPWQFLERKDLKGSYLTTDQLRDFSTILSNYDSEVGIPTLPYEKRERMVTSEAESRILDGTSRSKIWFDTLTSSIERVNNMFDLGISVEMRYNTESEATNG